MKANLFFLKTRAALLEQEGQTTNGKRLSKDADSKIEEASSYRTKAEAAQIASDSATEETNRRLNERIVRSTPELGISQARDDRVGTAVLQMISPKYGMVLMAIAIMISIWMRERHDINGLKALLCNGTRWFVF